MIFTLAWRNIWRNQRRSLIITSAIVIGLWSGLAASALMNAMGVSMIRSAIDRDMGHIQIHTHGFKSDQLLHQTIPSPDSITAKILETDPSILISNRQLVDGLIASARSSAMIRVIGLNPAREAALSTLEDKIVDGTWFSQPGANQILLGRKMSDRLGVTTGKKITLTVQGFDGNPVTARFRVAGIIQTESTAFDAMNCWVQSADLEAILGNGTFTHEMVLRLSDDKTPDSTAAQLKRLMPHLVIETWKELAPEMRLTAESSELFMMIFLGIILAGLLFGITNTMLMSVLERYREFGILMALGLKPGRVFGMILAETTFLSVTGASLGMILGWLTIEYTNRTGIDLAVVADGLNAYGIQSVLYPVLSAGVYVALIGMVIVTALIAAVYPGIKAIRLKPVEAIRSLN